MVFRVWGSLRVGLLVRLAIGLLRVGPGIGLVGLPGALRLLVGLAICLLVCLPPDVTRLLGGLAPCVVALLVGLAPGIVALLIRLVRPARLVRVVWLARPARLVRAAVFARFLGLAAPSLLLARHAKALLRFFQRRFGGGNLVVHVVGIAHGKTFRPASSHS